MFKIAGVKTEKEFYKKFPNEASFMKKHGKAFKKAQDGFMDKMGGVAGLAGIAGDTAGMISAFGKQSDMVDTTEQQKQITALNVQAMAIPGEKIENQYYRPEDAAFSYDQFSPGSVNTNILTQDGGIFKKAQDGKYIPIAQNNYNWNPNQMVGPNDQPENIGQPKVPQSNNRTGFKDWFGKPATSDQFDKDGNILQTGMNNGQMVAETMDKVAGVAGMKNHKSAYGKAGKLIGNVAGKFIPIPGAGAVLGKGLELIGSAVDPQARKIKKNQNAIERSMNQMTGMGVGASVQGMYSANVQDGGEYTTMDEDVQVLGDGAIETSSFNPTIEGGGESANIYGDAHRGPNGDDGGVTLDVNGKRIKGEGGEVISSLGDKKIIYGNLPITKITADTLLGDSMAAGKKSKNYAKGINKDEDKSNKALEKNMKSLNELVVRSSFDKLKLKGLEAMDLGHNMRLGIAAEKKQNLADWQSSVTETADEFGIVANDLARGKIKVDKGAFTPSNATTAQEGIEIPIAQDHAGAKDQEDRKTFTKGEIEQYKKDGWKLSDDGKTLTLKGTNETKELVFKGEEGSGGDSKVIKGKSKTWNEAWNTRDKKLYPESEYTKEQYIVEAKRQKAANPEMYTEYEAGKKDRTITTPIVQPTQDKYKTIPGSPDKNMYLDDPTGEDEKKKFGVGDAMAIANGILPYARPSDADDFDHRQLYGEMFALSHNKVEPVKAQQYHPQLDVPFDISLQDQRNDVTAATRSASKLAGYNPAAQAMIAAQSYEPLNKINAEEFRLNQAKKDQVYSDNRATMNQAQLTNLGILDQQANRQSIAKSNTKEATQLALNSIGDKYAKHRLENKTLGIYENIYNYRFGDNNIAQNMNPFARFNMQGSGNMGSMTNDQQLLYLEDKVDYMKKARKERIKSSGIPSNANPPWNGGYGQDGVTIKKTNLVKALKNY